MPVIDLSGGVPPEARWIKVHYEMKPKGEPVELVARLWSAASMDDAAIIRGNSGDVFVRLDIPQKLSFQKPEHVDLSLKVVAYKT